MKRDLKEDIYKKKGAICKEANTKKVQHEKRAK